MSRARRAQGRARKWVSRHPAIVAYVLLGCAVASLVLGATLVYFYVSFSRIIDARLHGERERSLPRVYARPLEVRRGEMKLASLQPGDVCGEMSFLENSNASASVVASKVSTIEFLSADELHGIFAAFPHLASRFYRSMALTLSRRLRTTSQQLVAAQSAQATK